MRILFDHGTPRPLRDHFPEHRIDTAAEKGWSQLGNGELLDHAERDEYDLMITTDQNMRYQQNVAARRLAIVVLRSNRWPRIQGRIEAIRKVVEEIRSGELREVGV